MICVGLVWLFVSCVVVFGFEWFGFSVNLSIAWICCVLCLFLVLCLGIMIVFGLCGNVLLW